MTMNPVLALVNCDSEDKFVRDIAEAYFQNPIHVRNLLTEDCIEACLDDYMRNQDVIADVRDLSDSDNEVKLSAKQRRAARRVQNHAHKQSDRAHGKKRMPSAKFVREADNHQQDIFHAHAKYVWHENHKGEWIPRKVKKHEKFRQERFVPSPDWDGEPDPLMPAERAERNQKIEELSMRLNDISWAISIAYEGEDLSCLYAAYDVVASKLDELRA